MTLGQKIQQLRQSVGLSQEELAEKLGTTRQAVSKWELDTVLPEIGKIVMMSKLFSVTTDSILVEGITTFDMATDRFICGIYRSNDSEIVETEKFAYVIYSLNSGNTLGAKLYSGMHDKKKLCAVCERDMVNSATKYAFCGEDKVVGNDERLEGMLGEKYDPSRKKSMKRLEKFFVDHRKRSQPKVSEAGIKGSLLSWKRISQFRKSNNGLYFELYTGSNDYVFTINPYETNIYCGASYSDVFEMGIMGGMQYFRLRNYRDNSEPFCRFTSDFNYVSDHKPLKFDVGEKSPSCFADDNHIWIVKRYSDDEIVLQGCGGDEYIYLRENSSMAEILCSE